MRLRTVLFLYCVCLSLHLSAQYNSSFTRAWGDIDHRDKPWVTNTSKTNKISKGLKNRHISVWASHGYYYDQNKFKWKWQRPNLFGTTEDLFTQTIVIPYLIPMLEHAGACVFTPRERDWQKHEVIIDNDDPNKGTSYLEINVHGNWERANTKGFARTKTIYNDGDNPFQQGSARMARSTKSKHPSLVSYQPNLPQAGRYAVYVSYQTVDKSVDDAEYIVYHKGQETTFRVNQQMGGGTWVYLGTFDFDAGSNQFNRVVVTNRSKKKRRFVTTDAVRFGGGMGNIQRGGSISGLPRTLEGSRYYAQWAGAPYSVYGGKGGQDDYSDDINTRSKMTNWLSGGSVFAPSLPGLRVPLELALAVHSDAGYSADGKSLTGSLAICTTNFNDGRLNAGISRMTSKDFANDLLQNAVRDLSTDQRPWPKRYLWDRNYSETRVPEIPSAILETMSHQNFPDMILGQDPNFKFSFARSIYKTILRFINRQHGKSFVVQPLAPQDFRIEFTSKNKVKLSWSPQTDPKEETATPSSYNVYMATGTSGFDNGKNISRTSYSIELEPDVQYNFKITACNKGGESFPTETLSAYYSPLATQTVLVVNGFNRLSAPKVIDDELQQGFDLHEDIGVAYGKTAGWAGYQAAFDKSRMGSLTETGLGYGGNELAGQFIAGNTFDYVVDHTAAIASSKKYNVASSSSQAVWSGEVKLTKYPCIDLILGLEKYEPYTVKYYKSFTPQMQTLLTAYANHGGAIMVSGSYIGSDMTFETERSFLNNVLKLSYTPSDSIVFSNAVHGLGMNMTFYQTPNEDHYAAQWPEILSPNPSAMCVMQYANGTSAAVAYKDNHYRCFTMGFPFECIIDQKNKELLMRGILNYLLE